MTTASPYTDTLRDQIFSLVICIGVFLTVWTAVVCVPELFGGAVLTGSSGWYAGGWLASSVAASAAGALVYRRRLHPAR